MCIRDSLNAYDFRRGILDAVKREAGAINLFVLEASSIVEIDYSASTILADVIKECRSSGVDFAVARLESVRAQNAFFRFGITDLLGKDHLVHSVEEAINTLRGALLNTSRDTANGGASNGGRPRTRP